ncbi:myelin expression factor [Brachionus plicatilis]|uniref:Myelin expression factor n=1 Tax=Brachionus plicatilis TaxID=10195 RepID=A0A3M7R344_BRAPC|nr:myelin expression factor [Brachionus plicatilis]
MLGNFNQSQSSGKTSNSISKVFVKNIPFSWDERKLREKFRQAGHIEYAEIKMKDGKSRGCGLIRFSSPQQAQKAVELFNGSRFDSRTLDVKLDTY